MCCHSIAAINHTSIDEVCKAKSDKPKGYITFLPAQIPYATQKSLSI